MKNILKVFMTDFNRISSNVVAVVIIMGLCVLPSLYAWFNIFSNWDPYGTQSTSNMKIAVFSEDGGEKIADEDVNVGSNVLDGLKKNSTIGWVFTVTKKEAIEGVYSGKYYAALIIPDDFTKKMIGFLGGDLDHPNIIYYENDKKNAIAPKITSKAKTAVQEQVNASFVSTLAQTLMGTGKVLTLKNDDGKSLLDSSIEDLTNIDSDLKTYSALLSSFIHITDAAQGLIDTSQKIIPGVKNIYGQSEQTVKNMQSLLTYAGQTEHTSYDMMVYSIDSVNKSLGYIKSGLSDDKGTVNKYDTAVKQAVADAKVMMPYLEEMFTAATAPIKGLDSNADQQMADITTQMKKLEATLNSITTSSTVQDTQNLINQTISMINQIQSGMNTLEDTYKNKWQPKFDTSMNASQAALTRAASALTTMDSDFDTISPLLAQYEKGITEGKSDIKQTKALTDDMSRSLEKMIKELKKITDDKRYKELINMLEKDPNSLGEFISSPINLETKQIYPIATYGSAMTPFYTVLALWVGALILVAIIHVDVEPISGLRLRSYQRYFGRYILFFAVGQVQTLITVLGDLFYIKIQCTQPFLFWLAASMTSFTFTLFIYSLTVAFHNVGEALAVVIMVVQVAGAGGTFPIEVLPKIYQVVYKYLPFPYAMNSMRETIGGMYKMDYWKYLLKLGGYVVLSLIIGLVVSRPFRKLNHMVDKSKENTEFML